MPQMILKPFKLVICLDVTSARLPRLSRSLTFRAGAPLSVWSLHRSELRAGYNEAGASPQTAAPVRVAAPANALLSHLVSPVTSAPFSAAHGR